VCLSDDSYPVCPNNSYVNYDCWCSIDIITSNSGKCINGQIVLD